MLRNHDLRLQLLPVRRTTHFRQAGHQLIAPLLRDKLSGGNRVDQHLELRRFQGPILPGIARGPAFRLADNNIKAIILQGLDIPAQRANGALMPFLLQDRKKVRCSQPGILIRLFLQGL